MRQKKYFYPIIAVLVILLAGFYAVDSNSKEASVFSLPDFSATTHINKSAKRPVASLKDLNNAFVNIADQTNPTVVTIRVKQTVKVQVPENPFFRFFGDPRGGGDQTREQHRRGVGSGVIVSKDGYILTNNHVVQNADEITVDLYNNKEYTGKVVGTDPLTDIAVVKIDDDNVPAIQMGNSDSLRVGEMVLALGSPENLAHSVSMGIISAKGRTINLIHKGKTPGYENYIQTDAAINPGNSGGALVNMDGKLVGINAAIASQSGGNEGIGFAVPINLAKSVMKSLIENGTVERGYLGIKYGGNVDGTMARALNLKKAAGVIVGSVQDGGPADKSGLKEGDVIQSINGKDVIDWASFRSAVATSKPGSDVTLGVIRDNKNKNITVTLGELPKQASDNTKQSSDKNMEKSLGFRVENMTSDIARQLQVDPGQKGVVVNRINSGSNAATQGLQRRDIVIDVNKQHVNNISDFNSAIKKALKDKKETILLRVLRNGNKFYIAFDL